jgi:PQQ-dependent dehydrogenase (methanol/ethanol family)
VSHVRDIERANLARQLHPASTLLLAIAMAWARPSSAAGYYTEQQAAYGKTLYAAQCAQCHGTELEGGVAPTLSGPGFTGKWGVAGRVHDITAGSMPPSAPGKLGEPAYLDILAYILRVNGLPAGAEALTVQSSRVIDLRTAVAAVRPGPTETTRTPQPQAYTWGKALPTTPVAVEADAKPAAAASAAAPQQRRRAYAPVTDAMVLNPPPADWLMWRRTLDSQGYSPLKQINRRNVTHLELAWAWPMASDGQQEAGPLVHDGIMFLAANNNIVEALDAKTGDLIWQYRHVLPELPKSWGYQRIQAGRQKNSIALYQDKVILTTADGKIVALDAATGTVDWEVRVHDYTKGFAYTAGPLVVNGKVIAGVSGCTTTGTTGGCSITAHDAGTGKELWRFNVLNDPDNPAQQASWNGVPPEKRWGGSLWITGSYDPRTNTTFWGTGMPAPYPELIRGSGDGEVLYADSTVALDADTGKLRWHFSHMPRDNWDMDEPFERVLVDEKVNGQLRHLLVTVPGKTGIAFVLDRDSGEFIWARDTIYQNVVKRIDPRTGKVEVNTDLIAKAVNQEVLVCPSAYGGKMWQAGVYSPLTHSFYVPLAENCNTETVTNSEFQEGGGVGSVAVGPQVPVKGVDQPGVLEAFNVADGKRMWRRSAPTVFTSSLLATAGGLLFSGDAGRYFKAMDQRTGEILWQVRLNAPIGGHPMTYEIDGEQYLVVPTGFSSKAANSAQLSPDIPLPSGNGNSIFVFKLKRAAAASR